MDPMTAIVILGALGVVGLFVWTMYTSPHTFNVPQMQGPIQLPPMPNLGGPAGMGEDVEMEPAAVSPVPKPPVLRLDAEEEETGRKKKRKSNSNYATMNHYKTHFSYG